MIHPSTAKLISQAQQKELLALAASRRLISLAQPKHSQQGKSALSRWISRIRSLL